MFFLHAKGKKRVAFYTTGLGLMAAALIACWSAHSNGSLILSGLIGIYLLIRMNSFLNLRRRFYRIILLICVWISVILFFVISNPLNPHPGGIFKEAFASSRWQAGLPTRLAIWYTTLEMIKDHLWFGVGSGNFTYVYPSVDSALVKTDLKLAPYAHLWTNAAHNVFLQIWAETGAIGLLLCLCALATVFHELFRRVNDESPVNRMILFATILALFAWLLQGQMSFPLQTPVSTLMFALWISVPVALTPKGKNIALPLLVPVEFEKMGMRVTVYLENMRRPARLALEPAWGKMGQNMIKIVLIGAVVVVGWITYRGLAAQTYFRYGREQTAFFLQNSTRMNSAKISTESLALVEQRYKKALQLWPWLTDCRSAWSDLLLRAGAWEESRKQGEKTRRRLDTVEVYLREAQALVEVGRNQEAGVTFWIVLQRAPYLAREFPRLTRLALQHSEALKSSENSPVSSQNSGSGS